MGRGPSWLLTLRGRVGRGEFAAVGLGLMALKYGVEALAIHAVTGAIWTPMHYLSPSFLVREDALGSAPSWFLLLLALWTLPFVWIGAAMCLRRARDARIGGASVLLFFLPYVNYSWMLALLCLPARPSGEATGERDTPARATLSAALAATILTAFAGLAAVAFSVHVAETYGVVLFLGVPFFMGFSAAYLLNRDGDMGTRATTAAASIATMLTGLLLLLFAIEGLLCIAMAWTPALVTALFGSAFGRMVALAGARAGALAPGLLLFPLAALEGRLAEPVVFEVVSAVEVDAPPERVWSSVVAFGDLPPPAHWLFATGIAYPLRARIEGTGAGAVRYCEFSTGAFVEPITVWDPPRRLAFDVIESPPAMQEWSFYARIDAPHLERSFRSIRGEFRLLPLAGGRTRLEGSTWYELELHPIFYWRLISDGIVHRIHRRVLEHIAASSEAPRTAGAGR